MRRLLLVLSLVLSCLAVGAVAASPAAAVPPGFTDSLVLGGFTQATAVEPVPDGRLIVLEKGGTVKVVQTDGTVATAGLLSVCTTSEMGLLSITLDANFATNGYVYVYRTKSEGGCAERLSRFTMAGNTLDPTSELVLIDNVAAIGGNHNGGTVELAKDGFLYLSIGDSGTGGALAQDMSVLNGKIVRITTTGAAAPGNPAGTAACALGPQPLQQCTEIYASGLRNPFRMAFDPNGTDVRFRINDVGQNTWEEVDEGINGANYGWPAREGPCAIGSTSNCGPTPGNTDPITSYRNDQCSYITGGAFVPNRWWPAQYDGGYLFADGGCGQMWLLRADGSVDYDAPFTVVGGVLTDMTFAARGGERALFYVTSGGQLRSIVRSGVPIIPPPTLDPLAYVPLAAPERVFDSRNGIGTATGKIAARTPILVDLDGVDGSGPAGTQAIVANITLVEASSNSYLIAWKPGTPRPATSNANVARGDVAANLAVLAVDGEGRVTIEVDTPVHVIIDVLGAYTTALTAVSAGRFMLLTPSRLVDTRQSSHPGNVYEQVGTATGSTVSLDVTGAGGIPDGARTVALTVTAIAPARPGNGYVSVYPGGAAVPPHSTVNVNGGTDTRANLVLIPVGADGTVDMLLHEVDDVLVDVAGWLTSSTDPAATVGRLHLVGLERIADSRIDLGFGSVVAGGTATLDSLTIPPNAAGVVQNVTMTDNAGWNWICATPNPFGGADVSIQNATTANRAHPALVFSRIGSGPGPRLRYCSYGPTDIIVDLTGWFE